MYMQNKALHYSDVIYKKKNQEIISEFFATYFDT